MSLANPLRLTGHCYCGSMRFEVDLPTGSGPVFSAYCHCDSCRRAHAAPLYRVIGVHAKRFRITEGESLLVEYQREGASLARCFCGRCGSKVVGKLAHWKPDGEDAVVFFPDLLDAGQQASLPEDLRATRNNRPQDCVLDWERLNEVMPPRLRKAPASAAAS